MKIVIILDIIYYKGTNARDLERTLNRNLKKIIEIDIETI